VLSTVIPHGVVGTGEDDPLDALAARRFEHVVAAVDVEIANAIPRVFVRNAGQVHDAVDRSHCRLHGAQVANVHGDHYFARGGFGLRGNVGQAQLFVNPAQMAAQTDADGTGGPGDQHPAAHGQAPAQREDRLTAAARKDRRGLVLSLTTLPALPEEWRFALMSVFGYPIRLNGSLRRIFMMFLSRRLIGESCSP
jgi:hypothetical protein